MNFWLTKGLLLGLSLLPALTVGILWGHTGLWLALTLLAWLMGEWVVTGQVARQVDRGRWPALDGLAAVRRLLRAGRGRLKRLRHRARTLAGTLGDFRAAATALPDGTLILAGDGSLLWFNRAAARLLNLSYPADLRRGFTHLVRDPRLQDWLATASTLPLLDLPAPADGQVRLSFRQVAYAQGLRLLVVRDITQMVRVEQVRRDFVANVSHELRTPLTVVNGYLDTIDDDEAPELAPVLGQLRAQSRRMVQIVEDLLTLSRLDAHDRVADEPVAMAAMCRQLLRDAEGLSQGRHRIELVCTLDRDLCGSGKDLRSAFGNLVSNAVRYTPAGAAIVLRWQAHAEGAAFEVEDAGIGIPAEHLPRLTERFYRVSTSRSRDSGGTGLGLAIVKHVLMLHQGHLEIESEIGRGSCFRAVLPSARLRAPAPEL